MNRKKTRKIIACICILAVMMSLVSCDSRKNQKDRTLRVGVVTYTPDDPFINAMTDILKEDLKALEASDMKVIVSVRSGDNSQQEQDEVVASWSDTTITKLKQILARVLVENEYLDSTKATKLNPVWLNSTLENAIKDNGDDAALAAFNYFS